MYDIDNNKSAVRTFSTLFTKKPMTFTTSTQDMQPQVHLSKNILEQTLVRTS